MAPSENEVTVGEGADRLSEVRASLVEEFLACFGDRDFDRLAVLCTEDFRVELPYSDPPQCLEGFAAYRAYAEPALEIFRFSLVPTALYPALDPDLLVAEYTSDGVAVPTGKPYRNVYIGVFRFRGNRLSGLREFFNPDEAARSLAPS